MKTLHEISIDNLNDCVRRIGKIHQAMNEAEFMGNTSELSKLTFSLQSSESELEYHRNQVNNK